MSGPIYILAGGGTGGHLYPGLAVAGELVQLQADAKVVFACSSRLIDRQVLDPTPYAIVVQPVRPMPRRLGGWPGFIRSYLASALQARQLVGDLKPAAVLGLGGFAAGPVVCRAAGTAVRTALLNPDAVPGKANRLLGRRVDAIFAQFAGTAEHFAPSVRAKVRVVGCPVRREFATATADEALRHFGLRADRKTLLVNGGSQGAATINEAVGRLAGELAELAGTWQVLHVVGPAKAGHSPWPAGGVESHVLEYCHRMDLAYAAADLAICRGGASTVAELMASGTPAVLLPYPHHADRQQWLNAASLQSAGAAVICDDAVDADRNAEGLRRTLLPILRQPQALDRMRAAAAGVKPQDAAGQVARWLAGLA